MYLKISLSSLNVEKISVAKHCLVKDHMRGDYAHIIKLLCDLMRCNNKQNVLFDEDKLRSWRGCSKAITLVFMAK